MRAQPYVYMYHTILRLEEHAGCFTKDVWTSTPQPDSWPDYHCLLNESTYGANNTSRPYRDLELLVLLRYVSGKNSLTFGVKSKERESGRAGVCLNVHVEMKRVRCVRCVK